MAPDPRDDYAPRRNAAPAAETYIVTTPADPTPAGAGERRRYANEHYTGERRHPCIWGCGDTVFEHARNPEFGICDACGAMRYDLAAIPREPQRVEREGLVEAASYLLLRRRRPSSDHWSNGRVWYPNAWNLVEDAERMVLAELDEDDAVQAVLAALSAPAEARAPDDDPIRTALERENAALTGEIVRLRNLLQAERAEATERPAQGEAKPDAYVRIPQSEDEAALMAIMGENWLREHAPHRLRPSAPGEALRELPEWFVTPEDFAEHLHRIGWVSHGDAQWDKIREVWRALAPQEPARREGESDA